MDLSDWKHHLGASESRYRILERPNESLALDAHWEHPRHKFRCSLDSLPKSDQRWTNDRLHWPLHFSSEGLYACKLIQIV
jgi:hypothetical protein